MKLFLAGGEYLLNDERIDLLRQVPYLLMSYYSLSARKEPKAASLLQQAKISILDSGAYSVLYGGGNIDTTYIENYCRFVHDYRIKNYIELDLDGIWPLTQIEQVRADMAKAVGWSPMPCWHPERGLEKLEELCAKYEYIAIGSQQNMDRRRNVALYKALGVYVNKLARKPRIHLMGIQVREVFNIGFFSCDASSSLVFGAAKGMLNIFGCGTIKFNKLLLRKGKAVTYLCIKNHLKAVEYYDNYGGNDDV